jgi:hypothetical protein
MFIYIRNPDIYSIIYRFNVLLSISDEIIKLNKRKPFSGPGSVTSRGTQQSRNRHGGKGNRNYQSNPSTVLIRGRFQGQGRKFNEVSPCSCVVCCNL